MNCREAKSLFSARIDGELSALQSTELEAHVAACAPCAVEARSLAATVLYLRTMPAESPDPLFVGRVLDRVRGFEAGDLRAADHPIPAVHAGSLGLRERLMRSIGRLIPSPIPVAATLAFGVLAGFVLTRQMESTTTSGSLPLAAKEVAPSMPVTGNPEFAKSGIRDAGPVASVVRSSTGTDSVTEVGPSQAGSASTTSGPVEVLAPDWWLSNQPNSEVRTVGAQSGGGRVVVF